MPTSENGSERMKRYRRLRFVLPGMIAVLVAAALVAFNLQIASHRSLYVVNGFNVPAEVRLEDGQQVEGAVSMVGLIDGRRGGHSRRQRDDRGPCLDESAHSRCRPVCWARFFKHPASGAQRWMRSSRNVGRGRVCQAGVGE